MLVRCHLLDIAAGSFVSNVYGSRRNLYRPFDLADLLRGNAVVVTAVAERVVINIPNLARFQQCQIRIPGICNHDASTTVFCHNRRGLSSGLGVKPPPLCGAFGCSSCHDVVDGRAATKLFTRDEVALMFADGCNRTLVLVSKELGLE